MLEAKLRLTQGHTAIDCEFNAGSGVTALYGPSGAGKTSILRMLAGLERGEAGTNIRFNEQTWKTENTHIAAHKRGVAMVFQRPNLFSHLNVQGNLNFAVKRQFQASRIPLATIIELTGIEHLLTRHASSLSGGEQQRVAIARALAYQPQLLLMDEPLSNLDVDSRTTLLGMLAALKPQLNLPIIYVSHQRDELYQFADDVFLLESGSIIERGSIFDLSVNAGSALNQQSNSQNLWQGRVVKHADDGLSWIEIEPDVHLWLPTPSAPSNQLRIGIPSAALSLSLQKTSDSSIINCLQATITSIKVLKPAHCLIELAVGKQQRLLATITTRSVNNLQLTPNTSVFVHIKGVNLVSL